MNDAVEIGYTLKPHGYKGSLKCRVDEFYIDELKGLNVVFLGVRGEFLPYFPDSIQITADNEAIIHFEELESKEEAQKIRGSKMYARQSDVPEKGLEEKGPGEFIGFIVEDAKLGHIGTVQDVYSIPQQELLAVLYKGREVLIPLRTELIHEFLVEKKTIVFNLPEGILEL